MNKVKMTNENAIEILNNIWDYTTANDENTADTLETALDVANIALDTLEKIKAIIREEEHYSVSTNHPNQADYDAVAADKFRRIWKAVAEGEEMKHIQFECCVSERYKDTSYCDEWGAATLWLNDDEGTEYNLCIDGELNSSAIYKMYFDEEADGFVTDYSTFEHYEINFNDANWKNELKKAMYEAAKKFFS